MDQGETGSSIYNFIGKILFKLKSKIEYYQYRLSNHLRNQEISIYTQFDRTTCYEPLKAFKHGLSVAHETLNMHTITRTEGKLAIRVWLTLHVRRPNTLSTKKFTQVFHGKTLIKL